MAIKNSPLIAQYLRIKEKVPDAVLFFRLGDFYEMFFEDAELGARVLDIQLTSRSKDGVPLCGIPYHAAQPYIAKLLKAGHKVAICEQAAQDQNARGLMPRQIVRVVTPGTATEELVLSADQKSFLLALYPSGDAVGLAAIDVSTGEFLFASLADDAGLEEEVTRLEPREIVVPRGLEPLPPFFARLRCTITRLDDSHFAAAAARQVLARRVGGEASIDGEPAAIAAGAALLYLEETFGEDLGHLRAPRPLRITQHLLIDDVSRRHLELTVSSDGARQGSLLAVLDETLTPVGARTLANWIVYPLLDVAAINRRLDAVDEFVSGDLGGPAPDALKLIGDLERLAGRIGSLRASPRDCAHLGRALEAVGALGESLGACRADLVRDLVERLAPPSEAIAIVTATLGDDPPVDPHDGNVIRTGFNPQVDELRMLARDARGVLARLETRERDRTSIASLKVRYNQVFGYYIEVTKTHLDRVPPDYERKQTLVGAERFTTPELKELERKILSAESGLKELELQLFARMLRDLTRFTPAIQENAGAVGELDALLSLARVARRRGYVRPVLDESTRLLIHEGRHPVLEAGLKRGEFVPNDLDVDPDERQLLLITGPNMAGKSTYLRQVALIVIMAQMGAFVPAAHAQLGIVDRIFTRIGARDDLRRGESTFMVEMRETARLLAGLSPRSLLLLDEVGRGTSTFDGLAIAWAIAEHLHDRSRAKVLFATHFHELTDLARERPRVKNLSMAVREWGGEVVFLRRVVEGAANRSYGIEVARLAGLPDGVVARAREILANLEQGELDEAGMPRLAHGRRQGPSAPQMGLFAPAESRIVEELKLIELERLTPIEAFNILARLSTKAHGNE